jgi:hypothetical protein
MRIVAIVVGAVLLIVAVRGTYQNAGGINATNGNGLFPLLKNDFESGNKGNFLAWFAAIFAIGAVGYIPQLKPVANSMLGLVILVLLLSNGGFFADLKQAVSQKAPSSSVSASNTSLSSIGAIAGEAIGQTVSA